MNKGHQVKQVYTYLTCLYRWSLKFEIGLIIYKTSLNIWPLQVTRPENYSTDGFVMIEIKSGPILPEPFKPNPDNAKLGRVRIGNKT